MSAGAPADGPSGGTAGAIAALSDREFALLRDWIHTEAGIYLAPAKRALLFARLSRRLRALGLGTFEAYFRHVTGPAGRSERVQLLDAVTTNETHFFRAPRQFEFLESRLFPAWRSEAESRRGPGSVRVWSAGCASGEEPFSVAMALLHHFPPSSRFRLEVIATDLSTRALEAARRAIWPIDRADEIPAAYRKAFMLRGTGSQRGSMRAGPELRAIVRFERLNLNDASYALDGQFDLILCRNVLIYFDDATRRAVLERLIARLGPRGHLLLGSGEGVRGIDARMRSVMPAVYVRATQVEEGAP
jgi:chemotaxis protein methyltransferase CheR